MIIGAVCASGVLAALVTSLFSRKKMSADAAQIITQAASGVVASMESELARHREASARKDAEYREDIVRMQERHEQKMKALVESHAEEVDEMKRVLQLHVAWDAIAIAKMAEIGIELPPAPPLLPARRFDHPDEVH